MPSSSNLNILRFGKALKLSDGSKGSVTTSRQLHSSHRRLIEFRSQDQGEDQSHNESFNRETSSRFGSSSTYRDYHRKSYERKRTYYEQEKKQGANSEEVDVKFSWGTNHYERLNLSPNADSNEIKAAYYGLSKQYHPDVAGTDNVQAVEQFRLITESYDLLSDPKSKEDYDRSLNLSPNGPAQTSWKPSSNTRDRGESFNAIYRMRKADEIFRSKQEDALERERILNPKRFRAGTFSSDNYNDSQQRLQMIDHSLSNLKSRISNSRNSHDSSDFYRIHLFDVVQRRKEAMTMNRNFAAHLENQAVDNSILAIFFSVIAGGVLILASNFIFADYDLADSLDKYLKESRHIEKKDKN